MKLFSWLGKKAFGDILADYGELPSDEHGWRVSVTLRRIREERPYLLFKWEQGDSNRFWTSLACTPEVYERLETIIRGSRDRVEKGAA